MADEMNVGRQIREDALATVGAVTRENDLVVGVPLSHHIDKFAGQFRSGTMIGTGLGFGGSAAALFPLPKSLSIAVEPHGNRQGEDFRGRPEWLHDDQAEDNPIVSPTDQWLGAAGNQRIVVHTGAKESQSPFAAVIREAGEPLKPRCFDVLRRMISDNYTSRRIDSESIYKDFPVFAAVSRSLTIFKYSLILGGGQAA